MAGVSRHKGSHVKATGAQVSLGHEEVAEEEIHQIIAGGLIKVQGPWLTQQ